MLERVGSRSGSTRDVVRIRRFAHWLACCQLPHLYKYGVRLVRSPDCSLILLVNYPVASMKSRLFFLQQEHIPQMQALLYLSDTCINLDLNRASFLYTFFFVTELVAASSPYQDRLSEQRPEWVEETLSTNHLSLRSCFSAASRHLLEHQSSVHQHTVPLPSVLSAPLQPKFCPHIPQDPVRTRICYA